MLHHLSEVAGAVASVDTGKPRHFDVAATVEVGQPMSASVALGRKPLLPSGVQGEQCKYCETYC